MVSNINHILIFVYGTLKKGLRNHSLLESSEYLGEFKTGPKFTLSNFGRYPVVSGGGETAILGEVYSISDNTLKILDKLERHPDWYHRILIETPFGDAYIYIMDESDVIDQPIIKNGIWDIC